MFVLKETDLRPYLNGQLSAVTAVNFLDLFFPIKFVFFRLNNFKAKKCTGEFCFKHFSVVLKWISSCNIKTGTLGGH